MHEIALFEVGKNLSGLIDQVAVGEEFIITRHGKAVARLAPLKPAFDRAKAIQAATALMEASRGLSLHGISIKELVNEGRQ
ncbi:MAG: type II toxin-antitoxin system prevent-host-death family antitoxin [Oscillospiraceae bacterium]|nr:type II toxin-antitoxin system prevent-host-death family antitoxin [Oscillospiraceae bacterium]